MKEWMAAGLLVLATDAAAECPQPTRELVASIERTNDGVAAINRSEFEVAVGALAEAIELEPTNLSAWFSLGIAESALKRHGEAAAAYGQAVALDGDDAMFRLKYGVALYKQVVTEAVGGAAIDPNTLALTAGELEAAILELERAIELEPRLFRAHYYLGKIQRHQGDWAGAAQRFTRAIELGPEEVDPYIGLGELYRRWDYTDQAIAVLEEGVAHGRGEPDEDAEVRFALGMAHVDKEDYAAAIEPFTQALAIYPDLHKARYARGLAQYHLGARDGARFDLEAYVKVAADDFTREVASKYLVELARKP